MKLKSALILFLTFALSNCAQKDTEEKTKIPKSRSVSLLDKNLMQWIDQKADSVMLANNTPAISIGIVKDGQLAFANGYGTMKRTSDEIVNAHSLYQIGSDTKKMTGIIVNNLVSEKKIELNNSVTYYLPETLDKKTIEKLKPIKIIHLLHHQSGLPSIALSNKRIDGDPMLIPYTEKNMLNDLNTISLEFQPGSEFNYSNFGYGVLGYLCELVSKKSYTDLVEQYVAHPYGMTNTTTEPTAEQLKKLVTPYRKDDNSKETQRYIMGKLTPAGGVYSNITDISKLMVNHIKAYQRNDNIENSLILTSESDKQGLNYGFGLGKSTFNTGTQYGHGGDMDGFGSTYLFSPEHDLGLIILTSSGGRWIDELEKEIFYKLTNQTYTPPKKSLIDFFSKVMDEKGFDDANNWIDTHKDSEAFYLSEAEMNNLGYNFLQKQEIDKAKAVFILNTKLFPESANVYDSLGEAYMLNDEIDFAIENYKKSLELNPENTNAEKMITKIKNI